MKFISDKKLVEEFLFFMKESGEEFFKKLFGSSYSNFLGALFSLENNPFSYKHAEFAVTEDGKVAGMQLSYPVRVGKNVGAVKDFIKIFGIFGFIKLLPKFLILSFKDRSFPDDYYLSNIAVYPDLRGLGIGSDILKRVIQKARSFGCKRVILDVVTTNTRAINFYKKHGFSIYNDMKLLKIPFKRMVKVIE